MRYLALVAFSGMFISQFKVDQGAPGKQGSWRVIPSAETAGVTTKVNVSSSADGGCQDMPASALSGRRAVEVYNAGPNALVCRAGSGEPGRPVVATTGTWALDIGSAVTVCCSASTASQVDGGSSWVTEIK